MHTIDPLLFLLSLFHAKHRSRFFELLALFLNSSYLPIYLVAAFIKRLSRLSLLAPPAGALFTIPCIFELLAKHPQCRVMIHRPLKRKKEDGEGTEDVTTSGVDPFLENEPGRCGVYSARYGFAAPLALALALSLPLPLFPFRLIDRLSSCLLDMNKCRALESSLWEIHSLTNHYHSDVADLAGVFSQKFNDANKVVLLLLVLVLCL